MIHSRDHAEAHIAAVLPAEIPCPQNSTGKSFSEALILISTNPQYDKRLFTELPVQHMKTTGAEHGQNMARICSAHVLCL